jgi:uncharacterized membrane protein YccC
MTARLRQRLGDPVLWTDAMRLIKMVIAAVVAWVLAVHVFDLAQPFLAPWAALLTVQATVYRTLTRGLQQVGAVVLGVLLAYGAAELLGVNAASFALAVFLALLAGTVRGLRSESTTAAATALVVLATGYADDQVVLASRLLDTAVGIGVGIVVTLAVWPPLRDRSAARQVDRIDDAIGRLLCDIATRLREGFGDEEVREWTERTRELDGAIDSAWSVVREASESGRLNPRPRARPRARASEDFGSILERIEQAVAETRSMTSTIARAHERGESWDPRFRDRWIDILERTGQSVANADVDALKGAWTDLDELTDELGGDDTHHRAWPFSGALILNLRNIIDALDVVAGAQPVQVEAPMLARR